MKHPYFPRPIPLTGMLELIVLGAVEALCLLGICACLGALISFAVTL